MPTPGDHKCIDGADYVWAPISAAASSNIDARLQDIIDLLNVIVTNMPRAAGMSGGTPYRSVDIYVDARRNDYPVTIGIPARNISVRIDQRIKLRLAGTGYDQIRIDPTESPFELKDLTFDVSEVYVTTGVQQTNVKIFAY